jgi:sugar O-acyltransferase (sialic acid O-acetyltransferase NeuD family)
MSSSILVYGAGGAGRELAFCFWLNTEKHHDTTWKLEGFIDDTEDLWGKEINGVPVLGGYEYLKNYSGNIAVSIGADHPMVKRKVISKIKQNKDIKFPLLTFPAGSLISPYVEWGEGCVAVYDVIVSANVKIGDFVFINAKSSIGHDVTIGDYTTIFASISISGGVSIGADCLIGSGVTIWPKVKIGDGSIISSGSVVSRDIPPKSLVAGPRAKIIRELA